MNGDAVFMRLVREAAALSHDRSTQVGSLLVDDSRDRPAFLIGYNRFPAGVERSVEARHQRPEKYLWIEHAERHVIYQAARMGFRTQGCRLYIFGVPCADCARAIIMAGIREVVTYGTEELSPGFNERWKHSCAAGSVMLAEAGVRIRVLEVGCA